MAEGNALAIPGLFLTSIELFKLARISREFKDDFGSCLLQLRATEIRLYRWSNAAGITDERSKPFVKQFQSDHSPGEIRFAYNAWKQIARQLSRAKEECQYTMEMNGGPEALSMIDEVQQMEICAPQVREASHALKSVKLAYERSLRFNPKVFVRGVWVIYKKSELTTLLGVIGEQVANLEQLFPGQERLLATQEAESMKRDAIEVLAPIATISDPLLVEALRVEAPLKGFTWDSIAPTENPTARFGSSFRRVPENSGRSSWTDMNVAAYSAVHAGDNYASETLPQMQSAYGRGTPATMDGDDWPLKRSDYGRKSLDISTEPEEPSYLQSRSDQLPTRQNAQITAAKSVQTRALPNRTRHEAKRGTTRHGSSLLEPSQPLVAPPRIRKISDRIRGGVVNVYDDGHRAPQGSIDEPETSRTNSKLFQGSIGFSSIGDAQTRGLSFATGLETHGIPERECGSVERDYPDDEHIADTVSIHTDGRDHNLDLDTKISLAETFAGHIAENLTPQQLNNLFDQPNAIASIADLIGDFSVLLGVSIADDDARCRAVTFVRHQRTEIAKELASAAKAWRPSSKDQVSMEEKLEILHFGDTEPTQYDDPNLEQDSAGSHQDEDQLDNLYADNDTPELRDVVLGRNFVLGSEELPWMIGRIRGYESLLHTGKIFSSVRSGITRTIESHSEHLEFSLDWDIRKTLDQQYDGESRSHIRLSDMIVYNGIPSMCYASTTSEYVKQIWPAFGTAVVECFDRALVGRDGTSTLALQDSNLHVMLDGAATKVSLDATTGKSTSQSRIHMLEAAEVCIWLAIACCANTREELIGLGFPQLAKLTGQPTPPELSGSVINDPSLDGQCWFNMVNNPVIASGYPIPKREDPSQQQGLEVSLGLMAALSHADWVTNFGSKLLLKGCISALVPIAEVGMSIVWHFLINKNQESMSYHQACAAAIDTPHLTYSDLECRRHFVGIWAQSARILAGSNQDTIYDLRPSRSDPVSHSTISWTGFSINGGKFLTVGTTFNIGKKDFAPALKTSEPGVYENHIGAASKITVLFYSSHDRRSWLLDGASALVHLARAWLTSRATEHGTSRAISQLKYIADDGGRSSALKILRENQEVKIFEETTEVQETSSTAESMSEHDNPSTDSGYMSGAGSTSPETRRSIKRTTSQWTYKSLVIDLWHNLEAMKAKLVQLEQHGPELSVRFPSTSPILTGWDVRDFLDGTTPLEPRFVKLKSEGKHWNKFTKEIFSVPLMAKSFHDLILPGNGSQVCQSASTLPAGRDLLAVPLSILLLTASRFLDYQENVADEYAQITDHTCLVDTEHPVGHCRCSQDSRCKAISKLENKAKYGIRTKLSIFERCPDAVVIIGKPSARRFWDCKTQESSSSTQAVLPVLNHAAASSSSLLAESSSSVANITSEDRPASQDKGEDLGGGDRDSLSGNSVYESC